MSPLDDELRAMFTRRAAEVRPAADPLAGIQERARRLRRTRLAAGVTGAALAVSAVALTVPALTPGPATVRLAGPTAPPSPGPTVDPSGAPATATPATAPPVVTDPTGPAATSSPAATGPSTWSSAAPTTPVRSLPAVVPPGASSPSTSTPAASPAASVPQNDAGPATVLRDWPQRGDRAAGPDEAQLLSRFAAALPGSGAPPRYRSLFAGRTTGGLRYTMGQAWFSGDDVAYGVSLTTGGASGPEFFLGRPTPAHVVTLAFLLCCAPGATTDTLVVVPQPRTGQVFYAPDGQSAFAPAGEGTGQNVDGVVFINRDPRASTDRLQLLDGNGDLDAPTFTGPVAPLLCGLKECG